MNRTPISPDISDFPDSIRPILSGAKLYDSSCSRAAKVIYIERDGGYYLKSAEKGSLGREAEITCLFHVKGLAAEVIAYESEDKDYLLTRAITGEDACHAFYLSDPRRLTDTAAEILRLIHSTDTKDFPPANQMSEYKKLADYLIRNGTYTASASHIRWHNGSAWSFTSAEDALLTVKNNTHRLRADTLIHGDYCLPNFMLHDWRFSGLIDVGDGGVGDRHIDIYWALWSLAYNLKNDACTSRFLDAYGIEKIDPELLRTVAAIELLS